MICDSIFFFEIHQQIAPTVLIRRSVRGAVWQLTAQCRYFFRKQLGMCSFLGGKPEKRLAKLRIVHALSMLFEPSRALSLFAVALRQNGYSITVLIRRSAEKTAPPV